MPYAGILLHASTNLCILTRRLSASIIHLFIVLMVNIHSLFAQLQARYPMSSLVTELIQCHENSFVVRASVHIGEMVIATGMAANPILEKAEDQARLRALEILGIEPSSAVSPTIAPLSSTSHLSLTPSPQTDSSWLESVSPPSLNNAPDLSFSPPAPEIDPMFSNRSNTETIVPETDSIDLPTTDYSSTFTSSFEPSPDPEDDYFPEDANSLESSYPLEAPYSLDISSVDVEATPTGKGITKPKSSSSAKAKATKPEPAISPIDDEPDDLSNLIALTDIEMDRVGWTKQQGREYLKSTYGKSTRQRLDIDELMDFLNYLRALPSLNGF